MFVYFYFMPAGSDCSTSYALIKAQTEEGHMVRSLLFAERDFSYVWGCICLCLQEVTF